MRSALCPSLLLVLLLAVLPASIHAQWFDPCAYHPHALQQLRQRFEVIVGQEFATEAIYAHTQYHLERYEAETLHKHDTRHHAMKKPLVLSFHGPTGTGKSLTAASLSSAIFQKTQSSHVHTYHGSDFSGTSTSEVDQSVSFLKREFTRHAQRCPLSLFILEEIHLMAPGVLDALRHLMDAQGPNARVRVETESSSSSGSTGQGSHADDDDDDEPQFAQGSASDSSSRKQRDSSSSSANAVAVDFSHVIFLFTTNIGSAQVQRVAFEAAQEGKPREALSPAVLSDLLLKSLEHSDQLRLLRESSVLTALIPFFPLFKSHVKQCAAVQLALRQQFWMSQGQLRNFTWDSSVLSYAASQLKYAGPISLYGCKNVHEILTHSLLSHLTRSFRRLEEEEQRRVEQLMRDRRVSTARKFLSYGAQLLKNVRSAIQGPEWNLAQANVSLRVDSASEEIVFSIAQPAPPLSAEEAAAEVAKLRAEGVAPVEAAARAYAPRVATSEIRKSLHAHPAPQQHTQDATNRADPKVKHRHMTGEADSPPSRDEL